MPVFRPTINFLPKFFAAVLVLQASGLKGQILNVEKSRIDKDSTHFGFGSAGMSFTLFNRNTVAGNSDVFISLNGYGNAAWFSGKHAYQSINQFTYTALKGEHIAASGFSHARVNLWRRKRISPEAFAQGQYDMNRGLNHRLLAGAGLRLRVYKKEKLSMYLGTGGMLERERWKLPDDVTRHMDVTFLKSTSYFSTRFDPGGPAEGNFITYYQWGYDAELKKPRQRISGEVNFLFKLTGKLRFTLNATATFDDKPIVPIARTLYSVSNGIQYSF